MLNGDGLRVVLFVSGCNHRCKGCHNPQTWKLNSGKPFTEQAKEEICEKLGMPYISGITISGGEPLHENNLLDVLDLVEDIKRDFPKKTIWLYTGYSWEYIHSHLQGVGERVFEENLMNDIRRNIIRHCDVVCDGRFIESLKDVNKHWVGSSNQRVIDVNKSLKEERVVLKGE